MDGNTRLKRAFALKQDEFYTQMPEIEKEMKHYTKYFKDKTIYCNCDDPRLSEFSKFFQREFKNLGLKRLIVTCYKTGGMAGLMFDSDSGKDIVSLKGDGDFASDECQAILEKADIIVTNPPFSKFRNYVDMLMEHSKDFILMGNQMAVNYKSIHLFIKHDIIRLGVNYGRWDFKVPPTHEGGRVACKIDETGQKWVNVGTLNWFTTLRHDSPPPPLECVMRYSPEKYPKFDIFDAINVDKHKEIPADYAGWMGVPITIIQKFNRDQFEMGEHDHSIRKRHRSETKEILDYKTNGGMRVNYKEKFVRIMIKHKHPKKFVD